MKMIVFNNYGDNIVPDIIKDKWNSSDTPRTDEEIISILENVKFIKNKDLESEMKKHNIFRAEDNVFYYLHKNKYGKSWLKIRIVDVDLNRPWILDEYDGAESIRYLKRVGSGYNNQYEFE